MLKFLPIFLIVMGLILSACGTASTPSPTVGPTDAPTAFPTNTAFPTFVPTLTPSFTEGLPALELIAAPADTCVNTEPYANVMGFDTIQYDMTTANFIEFRLLDSEGNVLFEDSTQGENKQGEESWGFYPDAYEADENSALVLEVNVYESDADNAILTSTSSLIYNCTTGETISTTFVRTPDEG